MKIFILNCILFSHLKNLSILTKFSWICMSFLCIEDASTVSIQKSITNEFQFIIQCYMYLHTSFNFEKWHCKICTIQMKDSERQCRCLCSNNCDAYLMWPRCIIYTVLGFIKESIKKFRGSHRGTFSI